MKRIMDGLSCVSKASKQRDVYCFSVCVSFINIIHLAEATQSSVTSFRSGWLTHNYAIGALLLCFTEGLECFKLISLFLVCARQGLSGHVNHISPANTLRNEK